MLFSYVSKYNTKCTNKTLPTSAYCYNKSHHPSKIEYDKSILEMKSEWVKETYDIDIFTKYSVSNNGWCFYNSIGMSLLNIYLKKSNDKIKSFFSEFENYIKTKDFKNPKFQQKLNYNLFVISKKWLLENINEIYEETQEKMSDFIKNTHMLDDVNEYFSSKVKMDQKLDYKDWGGICEQYALSRYFNVNIISFLPYMYSLCEKEYKIKLSKVVRQNSTRYKLSNCYFKENSSSKFIEYLDKPIPVDIMDDTLSEIKDTIFLVLFILDDDICHYNYLLYNSFT